MNTRNDNVGTQPAWFVGASYRVPGFGGRDLGLPEGAPGLGVDRDQLRVERSHEQRIAEHRKPAVVGAAADDAILGGV